MGCISKEIQVYLEILLAPCAMRLKVISAQGQRILLDLVRSLLGRKMSRMTALVISALLSIRLFNDQYVPLLV